MPFNFQPFSHSAVDPINNVSVLRPRMLPATLSNGEEGTEYQYSFYRGGERIGGLGMEGHDEIVDRGGYMEHVFWLDLGRVPFIKILIDYKPDFGATGDDFVYVRGIAQGLVMAFAGRTDNDENLRYVAVTRADALTAAGVLISDGTPIPEDGTVLLAEIAIPASRR
ncbi:MULTISPECIES: hypothetical protein [unclassified Stenotrophomonas]|uniref:hypothetical protein n=1 Tax=unclassified Stenotrophomonas TaxID=196198 RepID=UPI0012FE8D71|nr:MULTISPECIES: hypothetical protein [unclassified Stenotrophomonas]MBJ7514754.1 hypothetical protein [Stenotrophomonas sp.]